MLQMWLSIGSVVVQVCVCGMVHMWFSGVWLSVAGRGSVMGDMVQRWSAALVQLQRQQQNHLQ